MIRSLTMENYRGFDRFELHNLGRVNLLVGTNNTGKTSVLEAVQILESIGDFGPIWSTMTRRGETFEEREETKSIRQLDIKHLFNGHSLTVGNSLRIEAATDHGTDLFSATVEDVQYVNGSTPGLFEALDATSDSAFMTRPPVLGLQWKSGQMKERSGASLTLRRSGGVTLESARGIGRSVEGKWIPIRFISSSALSSERVIELFEDVVLTPEEDFVTDAIRIIEPTIERIAPGGTERRIFAAGAGQKGGLFVRCTGVKDRIPIGSLGDGIWRILGLALALARTEGGILLIDEIDTGLHYTVMESMWKLVNVTAKRHNIQVFATTHSRDCYESLAVVCNNSKSDDSEITIQRLERRKKRSVAYTEQEIIAASQRDMEVR